MASPYFFAGAAGAAAGAAAGGLVGALTEAGVSESDAHVYAEGVRRGGALVIVRTDDDELARRAEQIMRSRSYVDPAKRRTEYESSGWTRFDETNTAPWTSPTGTGTAGTGTTADPTAAGRPRTTV
jgi:hypothetical protein